MSPSLDERLRELARATHEQVEPSAELLGRIRIATDARPGFAWPRPRMLAAAAAVVAAATAASIGFATHDRGAHHTQVAAAPLSRGQFLVAAAQACDDLGAAQAQNQVVFPTPAGYQAVARGMTSTVSHALSQIQDGIRPPDAAATVTAVEADLRGALTQLDLVATRAAGGDTTGAQNALNAAQQALTNADAALATYGAAQCSTSQG
jgi:hypothetical protein